MRISDWSSDVCSSDLDSQNVSGSARAEHALELLLRDADPLELEHVVGVPVEGLASARGVDEVVEITVDEVAVLARVSTKGGLCRHEERAAADAEGIGRGLRTGVVRRRDSEVQHTGTGGRILDYEEAHVVCTSAG